MPEFVILVGFCWATCPGLLGVTQVVLYLPSHTFRRLIEFKPKVMVDKMESTEVYSSYFSLSLSYPGISPHLEQLT